MTLNPETIRLLRKVFIFSSLSESQLGQVAKRMKLASFPKGAHIVKKKAAGETLYLIVSGSVRFMDGDKTIAYLDRGDSIGEMAILASEPYPHSAVVDSTAEALVLTKKDFDALLDKNPALAVHLSRLLSSRLASLGKDAGPAPQPAKIFSMVMAVPIRDQVVFAVNLGLALTEQTKRKTLMVVVGPSHDIAAKSLGLEPAPLKPFFAKGKTIDSHRTLDELVMIHPSGLELLCLDEASFMGPVATSFFPFIRAVKENYDFCLFILPATPTDAIIATLNDSDRAFTVAGPQSLGDDLYSVRKFEQMVLPSKKIEKIWLSADAATVPQDYLAEMRLPWNLEWGRRFMQSGSPFLIGQSPQGQRMMDRLARSLGGMVVGFAMGSGAAFGYSLIGMLRVLERENIYPDVISGTSMGALIGSFYAAGKGPAELEEIAKSMTRARLRGMILLDITLPRSGLVAGRKVLSFLKTELGDKSFSELMLPFACVATDINTGKEIVLAEGPVAEAVRASISLPFFFEPYYMQGRYLVDGGLVNPVPTSTIISLGANVLISANLTSKTGDRRLPRWRKKLPSILRGPAIPEILMKTIYTMQYEIAQARSEIAHVVMQVNANDYLWWDLDKADTIIKLGEVAAEESLPKIKSLLPFFSNQCQTRLVRRGRKSY